jgi:acetyl-CoA synthetase
MSDLPEPVVTHPVAPRLAGGGKDGQKEPHVGPDLAAYRAVHAETVGARVQMSGELRR